MLVFVIVVSQSAADQAVSLPWNSVKVMHTESLTIFGLKAY